MRQRRRTARLRTPTPVAIAPPGLTWRPLEIRQTSGRFSANQRSSDRSDLASRLYIGLRNAASIVGGSLRGNCQLAESILDKLVSETSPVEAS